MVLNHITQLARLIEIPPASFDTDRFSHRDFNMRDIFLVPLGRKQVVGKTKGNQVLHRFFTQIMINTVQLGFGKMATQLVIDLTRGFEILPDWFFHHDAGLFGDYARFTEPLTNRTVK